MKRLLLSMLVLISCTVQAEIYKHQNEKGEWVYSDKPSPTAEVLKLPPLSTYTPPPVLRRSVSASQEEEGDAYRSITFIEPEKNATIRVNDGIAEVVVRLEPSLKSSQGHKIQYFLDGNPYGKPAISSTITLTSVERGSHTLGAHILNAKGELFIAADPVIFHVHKLSLNSPTRVPTPPAPKPKPNIK